MLEEDDLPGDDDANWQMNASSILDDLVKSSEYVGALDDDGFNYTDSEALWDKLFQEKNNTQSDGSCTCPEAWVGDEECDGVCNTTLCHWDGGDCDGAPASNSLLPSDEGKDKGENGDENGDENENEGEVEADSGSSVDLGTDVDELCSMGCDASFLGDGMCDYECDNEACGR